MRESSGGRIKKRAELLFSEQKPLHRLWREREQIKRTKRKDKLEGARDKEKNPPERATGKARNLYSRDGADGSHEERGGKESDTKNRNCFHRFWPKNLGGVAVSAC